MYLIGDRMFVYPRLPRYFTYSGKSYLNLAGYRRIGYIQCLKSLSFQKSVFPILSSNPSNTYSIESITVQQKQQYFSWFYLGTSGTFCRAFLITVFMVVLSGRNGTMPGNVPCPYFPPLTLWKLWKKNTHLLGI